MFAMVRGADERQTAASARPSARDAGVRSRMSQVSTRDTAPELALRRLLWARGMRFRVDVAPLAELRSRADIVFRRAQVAVYVDGCFWHGCPEHAIPPKHNSAWWKAKLAETAARDRRVEAALHANGWTVVRVWEHEDPHEACERIAHIVDTRNSARPSAR